MQSSYLFVVSAAELRKLSNAEAVALGFKCETGMWVLGPGKKWGRAVGWIMKVILGSVRVCEETGKRAG
ncbi:hypothetical protein AY498_08045 [Corynebacterium ulcerans]|uniref:Uncharacterized protein n=1 Tax=Corynebacterium ulcerans TaxID=65058 RepID=A0ABD0BH16_CORUL|nr:hypothetical protein D881_11600 [Corynebacterium ulcerans NCTC 12077]KPH74254.1 hypothetical protein AFK72_10055 [Corynebacterium ulcerans]BAM28310.1 hypothetical protein CULC0102_2112 [Corynebacterium ulcerans 0102]OIS05647.1 hypothetical protein BHG00_08230 [Corynebacterium ulcerans]PLV98565.1 hypothetical protein BRL53_10410 [Corynebacterium ulcerans]